MFQHTAARRRLASLVISNGIPIDVSTHSRPKAAGRQNVQFSPSIVFQHTAARRRLDAYHVCRAVGVVCFNTQPPEGGWNSPDSIANRAIVSTHSRPKAAGRHRLVGRLYLVVSTHSRPKAAGRGALVLTHVGTVSTHSRPKAAGLF